MFKFNPNRLQEGSHKYLIAKDKGRKSDALPPFTVADIDFYMPECLEKRLNDFIQNTTQGYNAVSQDYKESLNLWMKSRHNFEIKEEWLTLSTGVIPAIANALYAFTDKDDAVCIMSPVYHVFYRILDNLERKKVINNLVINDDNSYTIDFETLEKQFIEEDVKVMLFCSPHNPVGKVWPLEDLERLSDLCEKHQVLMISDEIHFDLILKGHIHTVYPSINEKALNHTILCTAASKTFNLAGLKTSNILIPNKKLRDQYIATYEKMSLGMDSPNTLGIYATQVVYESCGPYLDDFLELLDANYKTIKDFVDLYLPAIKVSPLEGTYLLWIDFRNLNISQEKLMSSLENEGLFLSNGLDFGENGLGFMRMNIATENNIIVEAMKRMKTVIENLGG